MNLDEQFLEMTDKTRLIEQVNENVTSPDTQKNLKTPEKSTSLAFFFIFIFNVFSMSVQCLLLLNFRLNLEKMIHTTYFWFTPILHVLKFVSQIEHLYSKTTISLIVLGRCMFLVGDLLFLKFDNWLVFGWI